MFDLIITDYLLISTIIFLIILCVWLTAYNKAPEKLNTVEYKLTFLRYRRIWLSASTIFRILFHWVNALSLLASILVIYLGISNMGNSAGYENARIIVYSSIGLFCTFLSLSVSPGKMAYGYRQAFLYMDEAIQDTALFSKGDEDKAFPILCQAKKMGEKCISEALHDNSFFKTISTVSEKKLTRSRPQCKYTKKPPVKK